MSSCCSISRKFWKQLGTHCFLCQSWPGRRDLLAFWDPMALLREHYRAIQAICGACTGVEKVCLVGTGVGRAGWRLSWSEVLLRWGLSLLASLHKEKYPTLKDGSHQSGNTKNRQTRQLIFPSKPILPQRKERFSLANSDRSCGRKQISSPHWK